MGSTFQEIVEEAIAHRQTIFSEMDSFGKREFEEFSFEEEDIPDGTDKATNVAHLNKFKRLINERKVIQSQINQHFENLRSMDEHTTGVGQKIENILDLYQEAEENIQKSYKQETAQVIYDVLKRKLKQLPTADTEEKEKLERIKSYVFKAWERHAYLFERRPAMKEHLRQLALKAKHPIPEHKFKTPPSREVMEGMVFLK